MFDLCTSVNARFRRFRTHHQSHPKVSASAPRSLLSRSPVTPCSLLSSALPIPHHYALHPHFLHSSRSQPTVILRAHRLLMTLLSPLRTHHSALTTSTHHFPHHCALTDPLTTPLSRLLSPALCSSSVSSVRSSLPADLARAQAAARGTFRVRQLASLARGGGQRCRAGRERLRHQKPSARYEKGRHLGNARL